MDIAEAFSADYAEARERFLAACAALGASVETRIHPTETGPCGEELAIDCARLGPEDAERVLVIGSGTHGIEGFCGSAIQTAWLAGDAARSLPAGVAAVMLHAHNPWGFAHRQRVTEDNVDLNRNFIDHAAPRPQNPGYAELHPLLTPAKWNEASVNAVFAALENFRRERGEQAYSDAFNGGQYSHADGIFFGGHATTWSAATLRELFPRIAGRARAAAIIDFHTGIGPYLGHIYLCFHPPGSPGYERARRWWGERAVNREGVTHKAVAAYQGLLVNAFCDALPGVETTAVVIEFGTRERAVMQRALLASRWLRFAADAAAREARRERELVLDAFYPQAREWRVAVLEQSRDILARAVGGICAA